MTWYFYWAQSIFKDLFYRFSNGKSWLLWISLDSQADDLDKKNPLITPHSSEGIYNRPESMVLESSVKPSLGWWSDSQGFVLQKIQRTSLLLD